MRTGQDGVRLVLENQMGTGQALRGDTYTLARQDLAPI